MTCFRCFALYPGGRTRFLLIALSLFAGLIGTVGLFGAETALPFSSQKNFGQYLTDHDTEVLAFFDRNGADIVKDVTPVLFGLLGRLIFVSLLLGWVLDVLLSRGFAAVFAPAFGKFTRSLVYASGQLVLSIIFTILLSLLFLLTLHLLGVIVSMIVASLFLILSFFIQIGWVKYLYRCGLPISVLFYLALLIVHGLAGSLIAGPMVGLQSTSVLSHFLDQSVTPKVRAAAQETQAELATAGASRDVIKNQVADVQGQLTQAQTDLDDLARQMEQKKNSEEYLFTQIVKKRAKGNLQLAHDQLADFLSRFPHGSRAAAAKGQLDEINLALTAQEQLKKEEESAAVAAAAQAQATLLARAAQGVATLSEMRQSLMGKTPAEVSKLFGEPTETASNRWGYGPKMILNPLTNERHGLTIYFADGVVQSVDYYYGDAR